MADADAALVAEISRLEAERGERLVATLRAALHTTLMVGAVLGVAFDVAPPRHDLFRLLPLTAPAVLGLVWGWWWYVHRYPYRRSYGVISVAGDVLSMAVVVAASSIELAPHGANANLLGATPPVLGMFFVLAAAALRQDAALCVFGGALAIVSYAAALILSSSYAALGNVEEGSRFLATAPMWLGRGLILGFATALAALAARNARRTAIAAALASAERAQVVQVFGRWVDPEVAHEALSADGGAEIREVTVLFTDLRGFTALTERMAPDAVLELLNDHYAAIVPVVHEHGGTVNKFIGDAVMATFGAPIRHDDHAARAVRAARAMLRATDVLNEASRRVGKPVLVMGVGVATGPVVLGRLGAANRVEYAVIGDAVNVASRLEGLNKELGTSLLIADSTRAALGDAVTLKAMGEVTLRGKALPVAVFTA